MFPGHPGVERMVQKDVREQGDFAVPYEQRWIMRSAGPPGLVKLRLAVDRCA